MTINENVVDLDEVVLVTQHVGPVSGVPDHPSRKVKPLVTIVYLRGGSNFTLHGELGLKFRRYFLDHVAKGAIALEQIAPADSND
jgi:hypothetical protein